MMRLIKAILAGLSGGAARAFSPGERELAQVLPEFLTATNQFLVAARGPNRRGMLEAIGDALESLAALRRILAPQLASLRPGDAMIIAPGLEARIVAVLDRTQLPADIDTTVLAVVSYSALVLPDPVSEAHFEFLWRMDKEQLRAEIMEVRRSRQEARGAGLERMARAVGQTTEAFQARQEQDSLKNTAILTVLVSELAKRAKR